MPSPIYPDLAGRVAVVTGGSRGIGAATARALAAQGVRTAALGRDQEALDGVVEEIVKAGGTAIGVAADVTDFAAIEAARGRVEAELGPVDVLAAFAGGGMVRPGPTMRTTEEEWRSAVDGNLTATFLTLKAFVPGMVERGRGSVITMASTAAREPSGPFSAIAAVMSGDGQRSASGAPGAYAAAKAGVLMLSRHLATEVARDGVRVNCVSPGTVLTERTRQHMPEELRGRLAAAYPLGRLGEPEDVASATLFLASDSSSWLTGLTIDVAGGRVMA